MANNVKAASETKKSVRFFCIILLVSSIFIWGFQTSWGDITIERVTLTGDNGCTISTLVYLPKNATNENPAPCVLIMHGRSNQISDKFDSHTAKVSESKCRPCFRIIHFKALWIF